MLTLGLGWLREKAGRFLYSENLPFGAAEDRGLVEWERDENGPRRGSILRRELDPSSPPCPPLGSTSQVVFAALELLTEHPKLRGLSPTLPNM